MPGNNPNSRRDARRKRVQKVLKYLKLLGFPTSTGGIAGTIILIKAGNYQLAAVTSLVSVVAILLAVGGNFVSRVSNRVLDKIEEELENLEEPLANWIVNQPKRFLTWLWWWQLNSQFQNQYYERLIDNFRELKIEGFRIGLPVLDLENVFVSLQVASEIPEKVTGGMIRGRVEAGKQEIWDFLAQSSQKKFQAFRRLAVIGPPGSGKTTLLKHLTLIYAKKHHKVYKVPKLIPVLLYLRDIRHLIVREEPPNLPQLIRQRIQELPAQPPLTPPDNWIEDQLKIGKCLVMLDGLDEVADSQERTKVSQWVNRQMASYRKTVFILTSRPHGYRSAPVEQVGTVLEVLPFNSKQIAQFIQSWYLQTEIMSRAGRDTPAVRSEAKNNANDLIERMRENRAIADMARNPLLVTMIATVHFCGSALPGRRVELYQRICDLLLGPRQEAKKIKTPLTGEQNKSVLQVLALALMQRKTRELTSAQGEELIQEKMERVAGNTLSSSQFLKQIKEISGLLVERELGVYEFAHLSFQEYLAAAQLKELQQDNLLIENLQDPWWAETIRLYAAQSDATNLIRQALAKPNVNSLTLAWDCLQESLEIEPEIREQLEEMLEKGLESEDPEIAKLAAEVKLSQRLKNLFKIDENLEIDTSYITCAEYQVFVDEWLNSEETEGEVSARKPITNLDYKNALGFCAWLSSKAQSLGLENEEDRGRSYYRLPTVTEAQAYRAKEYEKLGCWAIGESSIKEKGIRVIKEQIPRQYTKLVSYLAADKWEKADRETALVMLQIAKKERKGELNTESIKTLPCSCLRIIDQLWMHYSNGHYGLGVQVSIWESLRREPLVDYLPSLWRLESSEYAKTITAALTQKFITCGIDRAPLQFFDVVIINAQGEEIQRELCQARYFTEDLGNGSYLEMIAIPGGKFLMGTEAQEIERLYKKYNVDYFEQEHPQHEVTIQTFFMGKYPITQAQYKQIMGKNPSNFKGDERPVEQVSWDEAVEFCQRLSKLTRKEYRLPTEAEWEYACRAGTTTSYHFGKTITDKLVNYGSNVSETTSVGKFPPNRFGLYDMQGNIFEWCEDDWHDDYENAPTDGSTWLSSYENTKKVRRGGSWSKNLDLYRSAYRNFSERGHHDFDIGFRVVLVAPRTT